jgi:RND superfamily putative drug exporter
MAVAVAIDALLIRTMLVPAVMHMIGKRNWSLPDALDRHLPHLDMEGDDEVGERAPSRSLEPMTQ